MRKIIFAICLFQFGLTYAQDADPTLFNIGEDEVHVSEFKYIYEKNNADKADYSEESIKEYLELYKKFKLKVHRARLIGLDTIKSLQKELQGYRKQLANSYLKDKEISERLVDEVYARMREDREVSHIFVAADPKAPGDKVKAAQEKIDNIHDKLVTNKGAGFDEMARTLSEDKASSKTGGYLGYYTVPLPDGFYEFENAMYNTPKGQFSKPVRSKMGFHIVQVSDVRPARGEMEIAHILIKKSEKGLKRSGAKSKIDTVYQKLKDGIAFEKLAKEYSSDKKTSERGGYLGYFGVNQYERDFEDAAFGLQKDGDYSNPVETNVGYHIIRRISKRDVNDETRAKKRIEAKINNNDRFTVAQEKLLEDVQKEAGFKEDRSHLQTFLTRLDEKFYSYKWEAPQFTNDKVLFTLSDKSYNLNDFAMWAKKNVRERLKFSKAKPLVEASNEMYEKFVKESVMAYEEANLERKYPDFKALMREYREGILLFEITKNEVWDKASQDTVGLKEYYEKNRDAYKWPTRAKVNKVMVTAASEKDLQEAYKYAKKKKLKKFLDKYGTNDKFSITENEEMIDAMSPEVNGIKKAGDISNLSANGKEGHFYVFNSLMKSSYKTLKEARGYAIADYQDYLEKKWVAQLVKDHPAVVNEKVLKSIIK